MLGKVVHVQLMGGLGNQMFQYAAGRSLALRSNARLCIDAKTGFKRDTVYRRQFELGELPIVGELGGVVTQLPYYGERIWQKLRAVRSEIERRPWGTQVNQMDEKYQDSLREFRAKGNTWISGYWQSERYFEDFRTEIGKELTPVRPKETAYQRLAERMTDPNSIAVGVRLFEEVPASAALLKASITPTQFYSNAASIVAKDIAKPQFFVFCTKRFPVLELLDLPGPVHYVTHDEGYCGSFFLLVGSMAIRIPQCANTNSCITFLSEQRHRATTLESSLTFPAFSRELQVAPMATGETESSREVTKSKISTTKPVVNHKDMKERTDVGFVGNGNTKKIFEGKLLAWTPNSIKDPVQWYESFRTACLESIGKRYQPVYRMADGEFQFLVGRRLDWSRPSLVRELAGVLIDRFVQRPTIWGEVYCSSELGKRRAELVEQIKFISREGQLALFLYDNGIRACETYFKPILRFLESHEVALTANNYVPFHFPVSILVSSGWQEFVAGRRILIVSSLDSCQRENAAHRLKQVGAREVNFVSVSKTNALRERLDLEMIDSPPDLCLVAAGIGASNILKQLKPLGTLCLDIGSYLHCIEGSAKDSHGGVFHFPNDDI